jgi:hypothetical protein
MTTKNNPLGTIYGNRLAVSNCKQAEQDINSQPFTANMTVNILPDIDVEIKKPA